MLLQRNRYTSGQRLDLADLQTIEEFGNVDWQQFVGGFIHDGPIIVSGFEVDSPGALVGSIANEIDIVVADSIMFHPFSQNVPAGFFVGASDHDAVTVTLATGAVNYIEIDTRLVPGAPDTRAIWDPSALDGTGKEFAELVDTINALDVQITSNTSGFTVGRVPLTKIRVSSANVIESITDCRDMLFRLGTGGSVPDPGSDFDWVDDPVGYAREDVPNTLATANGPNPFRGSDKNIHNMRQWMRAVMTRIKEVSGTPLWFQSGSGGGTGSLTNLTWDTIMSKLISDGEFTHSPSGTIAWNDKLYLKSLMSIDSSSVPGFVAQYFLIAACTGGDAKALTDDDVCYVELIRDERLSGDPDVSFGSGGDDSIIEANVGDFNDLGSNIPETAERYVFVKNAADPASFYTQVQQYRKPDDTTSSGDITITSRLKLVSDYPGTLGTGKLEYCITYYSASDVLVEDRSNLPRNANIYWIAYRDGSSPMRIYARDVGGFIAGESRRVGGTSSNQTLTYIGGSIIDESTSAPNFNDATYARDAGNNIPVQPAGFDDRNYPDDATDGQSLTYRASRLSSQMADKAQDKNILVTSNGTFTWDAGGNQLSFTADIKVNIPGSTNDNTIQFSVSSPITLNAANQCAYFVIDRNASGNKTLTVGATSAVPIAENVFILARRGDGNRVYLWDGTSLDDGDSTLIGKTPSSQWENVTYAGTRTGTSTFTVSGDVTAAFHDNRAIQINDNGTIRYSHIDNATYSVPNTTVTIKDTGLTGPINWTRLSIIKSPGDSNTSDVNGSNDIGLPYGVPFGQAIAFTSNDTFTVPNGVKLVWVSGAAGGGGGGGGGGGDSTGGSSASGAGGGGGGSGDICVKIPKKVNPGDTITITIGTGGGGGNNGSSGTPGTSGSDGADGTDTTIAFSGGASTITLDGGEGGEGGEGGVPSGTSTRGATGGDGGRGQGGTDNSSNILDLITGHAGHGQTGQNGFGDIGAVSSSGVGGNGGMGGGNTFSGPPRGGRGDARSGSSSQGLDGRLGAGGGGGGGGQSQPTAGSGSDGGDGGDGFVIIEW